MTKTPNWQPHAPLRGVGPRPGSSPHELVAPGERITGGAQVSSMRSRNPQEGLPGSTGQSGPASTPGTSDLPPVAGTPLAQKCGCPGCCRGAGGRSAPVIDTATGIASPSLVGGRGVPGALFSGGAGPILPLAPLPLPPWYFDGDVAVAAVEDSCICYQVDSQKETVDRLTGNTEPWYSVRWLHDWYTGLYGPFGIALKRGWTVAVAWWIEEEYYQDTHEIRMYDCYGDRVNCPAHMVREKDSTSGPLWRERPGSRGHAERNVATRTGAEHDWPLSDEEVKNNWYNQVTLTVLQGLGLPRGTQLNLAPSIDDPSHWQQ